MTATTATPSMTFELNDEQRALRDTIREFAESEIAPHAGEWDEQHVFPTDTIRQLGDARLVVDAEQRPHGPGHPFTSGGGDGASMIAERWCPASKWHGTHRLIRENPPSSCVPSDRIGS